MVLCTHILFAAKKASRKYLRPVFIDSLRFTVSGGAGGSGNPKYGGRGGKGGDVYVACDEKIESLTDVKSKYKVQRVKGKTGGDSRSKGILGLPGLDVTINVPPGLRIQTSDGAHLGEVNKHGEKLLVANGGVGGSADTQFFGLKGQTRTIILNLNLIADVALVGYPNAGKSTLLKTISNAKPKVAAYPFTTVKPELGIIKYHDYREITVADLPGLMEGAHNNVGMGFKFLKHLDRTKMLLFIVDIQGFQYSVRHNWRSCLETLLSLHKEIELYKPDLLDMPALLIVNKMDTPDADRKYKEIKPMLQNLSDALCECDDGIRPERVIQFEEILTTSLILQKPDEIDRIKTTIRSMLDKDAERKAALHQKKNPQEELQDYLDKFFGKHTPTLT